MNNDIFKGYAWSHHKGKTVFNQLKSFGINGYYDEAFDNNGEPYLAIYLQFDKDTEDAAVSYNFV